MTRKRYKCLFCDKMIQVRKYREHIEDHEKYNKEHVHKNPDAERICGIREAGRHANMMLEPFEVGYQCPICKTIAWKPGADYINEITALEFSEYDGFMYCPKCNIDLPSYFCLHPSQFTKEKIKPHVDNYLIMIERFQKRVMGKQAGEIDTIQLQEQVLELKKEVEYYKNFSHNFHESFKTYKEFKEENKEEKLNTGEKENAIQD